MELDPSELLKRFIAADVGVGFIARSNVQEDVQANVLVAIPMAELHSPRPGARIPQRQGPQPSRPRLYRHHG